MNNQKAFLIILDGWGIGPDPKVSAIVQAHTPCMDKLREDYPTARLTTYGPAVGLPEGQMGNSEVGHLNIGAGRIVFQELLRINNDLKAGGLASNETMQKAIDNCINGNGRLHLMGLVSDGGVHSHIDHLKYLVDYIDTKPIEEVFIHAFTDGRDTDPQSGIGFIKELNDHIEDKKAKLATVIGRYYAMDRDKRWERVRLAYDMLVHGKGEHCSDITGKIKERYKDDETDEFLRPIVLDLPNKNARIKPGDTVIFFNFRTDRPRQLTEALTQRSFPEQEMSPLDIQMVTMTPYDQSYKGIEVLYDKQVIDDTLGEVISRNGLTQLRIAETEKYPHVTYFFSGGKEDPLPGESRILVPSPKVATYDLQPEMSAIEVTDRLLAEIEANTPDFICLNFANPDMVGHTGVFKAAVSAVETVDSCLSRIVPFALEEDYKMIIIADHGNADFMINSDGSPNTSHTMNPVPVILVDNDGPDRDRLEDGILADIAPTILHIMGVEVPGAMTGKDLIKQEMEVE